MPHVACRSFAVFRLAFASQFRYPADVLLHSIHRHTVAAVSLGALLLFTASRQPANAAIELPEASQQATVK